MYKIFTELFIKVAFVPLNIFMTDAEVQSIEGNTQFTLERITEVSTISVTALPASGIMFVLAIPIDFLLSIGYVQFIVFETVYFAFESLFTGESMDDLV